MKLSVIIVSYNAKYYLLNTLNILNKVSKRIQLEVVVVDNNSTEYNLQEIADIFSNFKFIANEENYGFSKANNIGVENSNGDVLLFLNPDTIIDEECINNALSEVNSDKVGAICVKMIDGAGEYLPESNRTFPTLKTSFLKLFGLSSKSYYNVSEYTDVLSGACLFVKRELFYKIGRWDERYFMYGEDIDLSLQIKKQHLKILYIDKYPIVHFKGMSTDKSMLKNNIAFYQAMKLYWKKNLSDSSTFIETFAVELGTSLLTLFSWLKFLFKKVANPIFDFTIIYTISFLCSMLWSKIVKYDMELFSKEWYFMVLPLYIIIAICSYAINNRYNYIPDLRKFFQVSFANLLLFVLVYFLLPTDYKFSRFMLLFIWVVSCIEVWFSASIFSSFSIKNTFLAQEMNVKILPNGSNNKIVKWLNKYSEYIFKTSELTYKNIVLSVDELKPTEIISNIESRKNVWLYSDSLKYAIKSTGKNEWHYEVAEGYYPKLKSYAIKKRMFEILFSILLIAMSPLVFFFSNFGFEFLIKSSIHVIRGKEWLGLPIGKKPSLGIFTIDDYSSQQQHKFLKTYSISSELKFLINKLFIKQVV